MKLNKSEIFNISARYARKFPIDTDNTIEVGLGAEATVLADQDPISAMIELEGVVETVTAQIMKPKILEYMSQQGPASPNKPLDPDPQIADIKARPQPQTWGEVGQEGKELLYGEDKKQIALHVPALDTFTWCIEEYNGKRWAKIKCGHEPLGEDGVWYKHGVKCWPEVMRKYLDTNIEDQDIYPGSALGKDLKIPGNVAEIVVLYDTEEKKPMKIIKFVVAE